MGIRITRPWVRISSPEVWWEASSRTASAVQENVANGLAVGTVTKRKSHGANALSYSIASGNNGGAFSINPTTGLITVADRTQLDYEALSLQWDDPATIEFTVNIVDAVDASLNESVRVVVTVTNINEVPTLAGGSVTAFSHSRTGTLVYALQAVGRRSVRFRDLLDCFGEHGQCLRDRYRERRDHRGQGHRCVRSHDLHTQRASDR